MKIDGGYDIQNQIQGFTWGYNKNIARNKIGKNKRKGLMDEGKDERDDEL